MSEVGRQLLGMRVRLGCRGDPRDVRPAVPPGLASGGVQPAIVNVAHAPGWDELCQLGDEIRGIPQTGVLLEVGVVVGMVEDLSSGLGVGQFLQGQRTAGDVLSEGLTGVVIPAIEADGVVHGEPGMSPAQEVLGEPAA